MMIDNLSPQTAYSIRLVAINAVGEGTPVEFEHTTKARCKFTLLPHALDKWELLYFYHNFHTVVHWFSGVFFPFQNNPINLDPACKTDLDF